MHARDPADLYKDKVEVSLDGRQIFYLFFGGAVIVGLVFVLGVMVGRRVEARGHVDPARTAAAADPLAALDRLEGKGGGLSFKGSLTGTPAPTEVERAIGELEKSRKAAAPGAPVAPAKVEKKPEPKGGVAVAAAVAAEKAKPEPKAEKAERAEKSAKAEKKPEPKGGEAAVAAEKAKPEPKGEKAERAEKSEKSEKSERAEKGERSEKSERAERKRKKSDGDGAESGSEPRGRFTLQLSSFQDKQEAEAFLDLLKGAGYQPYVTEAEVSGKGTFYRVRLGSYRSLEAATDAKAEVERVSKKIASVMRL